MKKRRCGMYTYQLSMINVIISVLKTCTNKGFRKLKEKWNLKKGWSMLLIIREVQTKRKKKEGREERKK